MGSKSRWIARNKRQIQASAIILGRVRSKTPSVRSFHSGINVCPCSPTSSVSRRDLKDDLFVRGAFKS
jgi:hypothetical protein